MQASVNAQGFDGINVEVSSKNLSADDFFAKFAGLTGSQNVVMGVPGWNYGLEEPSAPVPSIKTRRLSFLAIPISIAVIFAAGKENPGIAALGFLGLFISAITYLVARAKDGLAAWKHAKALSALRQLGYTLSEDQLTVLLYFALSDSELTRSERDTIVDYALQEKLIPTTWAVQLDESIRWRADPGTPALREALARLAEHAPKDRKERLLNAAEKIVETGEVSDTQRHGLADACKALMLRR